MSETFTPKTLIAGDFPRISESVILAAGQNVLRGTVLGKIVFGAVTATAKTGGNTGAGTLTLPVKKAKTQPGVYTVRCVTATKGAGAITSAAKAGGNTGAGTVTLVSKGASAKVGVYTLRCIADGVGVGTFEVVDPDGYRLASVIASAGGTAYAGQYVNFTLTAAGTDFAVGDGFDLTVAEATGAGTFKVYDPNGIEIGTVTASTGGTAFANAEIGFTLTSAGANFVVGDGFDLTVAAGSGQYVTCVSTAIDGSQNPVGIAGEDMDATSAARNVSLYRTGEFVQDSLIFGGSDTIATHVDALRARSIYVRPIMA